MKRQSTYRGHEHFEIRNTGLRPNWNSFWALASSDHESVGLSQRTQAPSFFSYKSSQSLATVSGVKHVRFVTGSEWIGEWDRTGMSGMGLYKMPHGVIYEGTLKAGLFEGIGVLKYPNGGCLEGLWYQGKLKYWQYDYADGLERDCQHWTYCTMPDRRFYSEHVLGFRPATIEQLSNGHPPREVPPGHYDVGQGFFNPKTHCVTDAITGEILSIPTSSEEKWILERCRSSEPIETIGFRPDLYENLFKPSIVKPKQPVIKHESYNEEIYRGDSTADSTLSSRPTLTGWSPEWHNEPTNVETERKESQHAEDEYETAEREILSLLQQEGAKLHPIKSPIIANRKISLFDKLESSAAAEPNLDPPIDIPRATSFEGLLKKIAKEIELNVQSIKTSDESGRRDDTNSTESNLYRLTQIINAYAEITYRKKTASSSVGSGALEQFRILGKFLPSSSLTKRCIHSDTSQDLESDQVGKLIRDRVINKDLSEESTISTHRY